MSVREDYMKRTVWIIGALACFAVARHRIRAGQISGQAGEDRGAVRAGRRDRHRHRIVAEQMRQSLGQSFVVENKPGAFGIVAIQEMVNARPDGYTLMAGNVSTNAITPVLVRSG